MKKSYLLLSIILIGFTSTAQNLIFKDENFLKAVLTHEPRIDLNGDNVIQKEEADEVKKLSLMEKNIQFADDAYLFPNLEILILTRNQITEVRLTGFHQLKEFYCAVNTLKKIEVNDMPELTALHLNFNDSLSTVSLGNLPKLTSFSAEGGQLKSFDPVPYPKLVYLSLSDNNIVSIDISKNPEIVQLRIADNPIKELDIRFNSKLQTHILYVDPSVKLITTPSQSSLIKSGGLGKTLIEIGE